MSDFFDDLENVEVRKEEQNNIDIFDSGSSYYKIYVSRSNTVYHYPENPDEDFMLKHIIKRMENIAFSSGTNIRWKVESFKYRHIGNFDEYQIVVDLFGTFSTFSDFWKVITAINILPKFKLCREQIYDEIRFRLIDKVANSSENDLIEFCLFFKDRELFWDREYFSKEASNIYEFAEYFMDGKFRDLNDKNQRLSLLYKLSQPSETYIDHCVHNVTMAFMEQLSINESVLFAGYSFRPEHQKRVNNAFEFSDKAMNIGGKLISEYAGKKICPYGFVKLLKSGWCDMSSSNVVTAIGILYEKKMSEIFIWDGWYPKSFDSKTNLGGYSSVVFDAIENRTNELLSVHNKIKMTCTIAEDKRQKDRYVFGVYLGEIFDLVSSDIFQKLDPMTVVICFYGTYKGIKKCIDMLYG